MSREVATGSDDYLTAVLGEIAEARGLPNEHYVDDAEYEEEVADQPVEQIEEEVPAVVETVEVAEPEPEIAAQAEQVVVVRVDGQVTEREAADLVA